MRMRMPRFRIRSLMVVVALVALTLWGDRLYRLSKQYRARAGMAADLEGRHRYGIGVYAEEATKYAEAAAKIRAGELEAGSSQAPNLGILRDPRK